MANVQTLETKIQEKFKHLELDTKIALGELTLEVAAKHLHELCLALRDDKEFHIEELVDICGVDYSEYGVAEWATTQTSETGFSRGVESKGQKQRITAWDKPRFAVIYHLLSLKHNHRLRIRSFVAEEDLMIDSVVDIWETANWFEREAYDLYGIIFKGHNDLRRILTDYGFIGHPFRKDFPLIGYVEPRYDAKEGRVVYEPVSIEPRTLVPKVIRDDHRYEDYEGEDQ